MSSILNDLSNYVPNKDKHNIIEQRVKNVIASFNNVSTLIDDNFSKEESEELKKRILLSIKNNDPDKFVRKIREYKKNSENLK